VHSNQRIASCPEQFEDPRRLPMNVSFSSFIPTYACNLDRYIHFYYFVSDFGYFELFSKKFSCFKWHNVTNIVKRGTHFVTDALLWPVFYCSAHTPDHKRVESASNRVNSLTTNTPLKARWITHDLPVCCIITNAMPALALELYYSIVNAM